MVEGQDSIFFESGGAATIHDASSFSACQRELGRSIRDVRARLSSTRLRADDFFFYDTPKRGEIRARRRPIYTLARSKSAKKGSRGAIRTGPKMLPRPRGAGYFGPL